MQILNDVEPMDEDDMDKLYEVLMLAYQKRFIVNGKFSGQKYDAHVMEINRRKNEDIVFG